MTIQPDELRRIMGLFATGVTIVTLLDDTGRPQGLTVNSVTCVSLYPPLLLVCVDRGAVCFPCFKEGRGFAVNILTEEQEALSRRFASRVEDKFEGLTHRPGVLGSPLLKGCLGYLECRIVQAYPGGDHVIFVGEVLRGEAAEGRALLFYQGKYTRL
jgi:flavin reductase (DIM6/NTAB) family NADH-FMN oxidoreductase RutF